MKIVIDGRVMTFVVPLLHQYLDRDCAGETLAFALGKEDLRWIKL
jgi:hypothetical protein